MRAILIDPETKTFTEVEHVGDYKDIQRLIDNHPLEAIEFVASNGQPHTIYFDEEGLLRADPRYFWLLAGAASPISGKGLVLGQENKDGEGIDSAAATVTLGELRNRITFQELRLERVETFEGTVNHPFLGPNTPMIGSRPIFSKRETK